MIRRNDDSSSRRRRSEQPISRLFPNIITLAGMCCGMSAIRFAMLERWELAVGFVLAAALIDGMDGRVARMLGATSVFGAQLDSLSDFLSFGVSPAIVIYMWQLHDIKGLGWAVVLIFAVCTALRLARFNTALFDDHKMAWKKKFFVGVPSPAGGILCLMPIILNLQSDQAFAPPALSTAAYVLIIGLLMASRIPTFSGKGLHIRHEIVPLFMIVGTILLVFFIIEPWLFIVILSGVYILSIGFAIQQWRKYERLEAPSVSDNS